MASISKHGFRTAVALAAIFTAQALFAQLPNLGGGTPFGEAGNDEKPVTASATAKLDPQSGKGLLTIRAKIKKGWHIFSITQKPGGPLKAKLSLDKKADAEFSGDPKALTKPESHPEPAFNNLIVESHEGEAVWEVPIQLKAGVEANSAKITGMINAQACEGTDRCLPPTNYPFTAKVALATPEGKETRNSKAPPAMAEAFRPNGLHVALTGRIEPGPSATDGIASLVIQATPDANWHVYALSETAGPLIGPQPTLIALTETGSLRYLKPVANAPPFDKPGKGSEAAQSIHESPVRWTVEIELPPSVRNGEFPIMGIIGLQTCKGDLQCDRPRGARFEGTLKVADGKVQESSPLHFMNSEYASAKQQLAGIGETNSAATPIAGSTAGDSSPYRIVPLNDAGGSSTLPVILLSAFVGGLILNLMPCVLPVIGLKILGFAEQAGHSRRKILTLNLWYAAGMLSVFLTLATLAASAKLGISEQGLGWGEQNSNTIFNVVMAAIVFVMALSFLGIWEIPIPGFVGSGKSQELASREGASGAFAKGIVTTLLATPCSGPFLGSVIGFTLTQPPATIYMIFAAIGLGMASPYLVIGAFPSLIGWIPKPGAWMETFKHIMGFVLLGTVAFIFSYMNKDYIVPTFVLLIGLWAACWWIGRTPTYEPVGKQLAAWVQGGVFASLIGGFAFTQLLPRDEVLPWQPFNRVQLTELNRQGKTVLVDFSADWCLTCKYNLKTAINTQDVADAVEKNRVVTMLADWTDGSDEVTQMLNDLKSNSIPVLAIFPADNPNEVLVLRDLVTKRQVLDAISKAGPSRGDRSIAMTNDE
jgi:thiol:disulfide interchange protein